MTTLILRLNLKPLNTALNSPESLVTYRIQGRFCRDFFGFYNSEHRHSVIGLVTPEQLLSGQAQQVYDQRFEVPMKAKNLERFKGRESLPPTLPTEAWINKPKTAEIVQP